MAIAKIRATSYPPSSRLGDFLEEHLASRSPTIVPIDKHTLALYLTMLIEKINELTDAVNALEPKPQQ